MNLSLAHLLYYNPGKDLSEKDYYPFGMLMPGRNFSSENYQFGFNGKETDNEINGSANSYDYGFRIYDPRLGRFLSVDPLSKSYPWYTPYQYAGNSPVLNVDLDGLENLVGFELMLDVVLGWQKLKTTGEEGIKSVIQSQASNSNQGYKEHVPIQVQENLKMQQFSTGVQKTYTFFSGVGHLGLDIMGSVPLMGEPIDAVNGAWYAVEGEYAYAGITFLSAVGIGEALKYGKNIFKYGPGKSTFLNVSKEVIEKVSSTGVTADKVRFFDQGDASKVIVIGRNQDDRVEKVGRALGADFFHPGDLTGEELLSANKQWIKGKLDAGYSVLDLGLDPDYTKIENYQTGKYYGAEIGEVVNFFGKKLMNK